MGLPERKVESIKPNTQDSWSEPALHPYGIDHKPGFFLSWLFYKLLKKVRVEETWRERLKQLHKQGTIVYTAKYGGRLDYLLYHYNFRIKRLPFPKLAFDLNVSVLLPHLEPSETPLVQDLPVPEDRSAS